MRRVIVLAIVLIGAVLFSVEGYSQRYMTHRKNREIFPDAQSVSFKRSGWLIDPGFTRTATKSGTDSVLTFNTLDDTIPGPDSLFCAVLDPKGRTGIFYLGIGRYHIMRYGFIKYIDYSLGYKRLKGSEEMMGYLFTRSDSLPSQDSLVQETFGNWTFKDSYLSANFNINHVFQVNDNTFIQNSLGVNVDYRFASKIKCEGDTIYTYNHTPKRLLAQLHYKLGVGFKVRKNLLIIPTLEMPILNLYKYDDDKSTIHYFNSWYRPFVFTVRFLIFRSPKVYCPPVKGHPDDKKKQKQFDKMRDSKFGGGDDKGDK